MQTVAAGVRVSGVQPGDTGLGRAPPLRGDLPGPPIRADTAGRLALQPVKFPLRDRQMPRVGITLPVERTANDLTGEVDTMKANLKQRRAEKSYGVPPLS